MISCLNRPQLNIHSFWCGLLGSFFGMCAKETKGCAFDFQRHQAPLYRVKQSLPLISRVVGKMFTLATISEFALEHWNKNNSVIQFAIQSLIKLCLQGFCSMCHVLPHHETSAAMPCFVASLQEYMLDLFNLKLCSVVLNYSKYNALNNWVCGVIKEKETFSSPHYGDVSVKCRMVPLFLTFLSNITDQ